MNRNSRLNPIRVVLGLLPLLSAGVARAASTAPASAPAQTPSFFEKLAQEAARLFPSGAQIAAKVVSVLHSALVTAVALAVAVALVVVLRWLVQASTAPLARRASASARKQVETIRSLIASIIKYVVLIIAGLWILSHAWGVDTSSLVVGTAVLGAALGFGSQGLVQDIITGISLLLENELHVGDWVDVGGKTGVVETVGLRTIRLRGADGQVHIIFNRSIGQISSYAGGAVTAAVDVNLADAASAPAARQVLADAAEAMAQEFRYVLPGPQVGELVRPGEADRYLRVLFRVQPSDQAALAAKAPQRFQEALKAANLALGPNGIDVHFLPAAPPRA